jgi:pyroglutamyl-peptidase
MSRNDDGRGCPRPHTGRSARRRVLITGFGPFPGVPVNATMRLVPELQRRAEQAFGVTITAGILPTEWVAAPAQLDHLLAASDPDLVVHFGVSSRARGFEIELRANNTCAPSPDASGALPYMSTIRRSGASTLPASLPVQYLATRLRRIGVPAFASRDAGAYLCNWLLYHSLERVGSSRCRRVGFIHIPASLAQPGGPNRGRCGGCPLSWRQAIVGGLEILAACLGRPAPSLRATPPAIAQRPLAASGLRMPHAHIIP